MENKIIIWLVVLVVILSIVFTWKALDQTASFTVKNKPKTGIGTDNPYPSAVLKTTGTVGINLVKEAA